MYIHTSRTRMIKITPAEITDVPLGTDNVICVADDLGDWPELTDLLPHVESLRPVIGSYCTQIAPTSPLAKLTSRWKDGGALTAPQQWQVAFTRVLFLFAASQHKLWPTLFLTGLPNSGKSSFPEVLLTLLNGVTTELTNFPSKEDALIAAMSRMAIVAFDNIDDFDFQDAQHKPKSNLVCQMSTGGSVPMFRKYKDNELLKFSVRNHGIFTAVQNPQTRVDVERRTLTLQMADPMKVSDTVKANLFKAILADRPAMLAEILIRCQNIAKAHLVYATKPQVYRYQSQMPEYEHFTLLCSQYEGTLQETQAIWSAMRVQSQKTVSESNPLVYAIRLWLGDKQNVNKEVTSMKLHSDLTRLYRDHGLKLPWGSPSYFGKKLNGMDQQSLEILGFNVRVLHGMNHYWFNPSPEQMAICSAMSKDLGESILPAYSFTRSMHEHPLPFTNYLEDSPIDPQVI
jgi:hypothetical protein